VKPQEQPDQIPRLTLIDMPCHLREPRQFWLWLWLWRWWHQVRIEFRLRSWHWPRRCPAGESSSPDTAINLENSDSDSDPESWHGSR